LAELQRRFDRSIEDIIQSCQKKLGAHQSSESHTLDNQMLRNIRDHIDTMQERSIMHDVTVQGIIDRLDQLSGLVCDSMVLSEHVP